MGQPSPPSAAPMRRAYTLWAPIYDRIVDSASPRCALNVLTRHIATRTDLVFEDIIAQCLKLRLAHDEPAFMRGWFRHKIVIKEPMD